MRDGKEVYRRKLENKLHKNNVNSVWSGMRKITGFKQKKDQIDGKLDRANNLNSFFNRFSLETSSASSSPAPTQTQLPFSLDPQFLCHISTVSSSIGHGSCCCSIVVFNHISRCRDPPIPPHRLDDTL